MTKVKMTMDDVGATITLLRNLFSLVELSPVITMALGEGVL